MYNYKMVIRFTSEGLEKIKREYSELLSSRPAAVLDLKQAREKGDLSENGHYKAARAKLSSVDHKLRRFKDTIRKARVVTASNSDHIGIGSVVTLSNGEKYEIVGDLEANPREGKISLLSPLGRALEGKSAGDKIIIRIPSGHKFLSITTVA